MDRVTVSRDPAGAYRWTRRSDSGRQVAASEDGYADMGRAMDAARDANPGLPVRAWRGVESAAAPSMEQQTILPWTQGKSAEVAGADRKVTRIAMAEDVGPPRKATRKAKGKAAGVEGAEGPAAEDAGGPTAGGRGEKPS